MDAARLFALCTNAFHASPSVADIGTAFCGAYIEGVHDAMNGTRLVNGAGPCPSEGFDEYKATSAFTRFLSANPTYAQSNAAIIVALAIGWAWNCR
jgi:Rap1a immunity proteins